MPEKLFTQREDSLNRPNGRGNEEKQNIFYTEVVCLQVLVIVGSHKYNSNMTKSVLTKITSVLKQTNESINNVTRSVRSNL